MSSEVNTNKLEKRGGWEKGETFVNKAGNNHGSPGLMVGRWGEKEEERGGGRRERQGSEEMREKALFKHHGILTPGVGIGSHR